MSEIRMTRLPGGLRVITDNIPHMHTVAIGAWVGVGTRHEDMINNGVAHLVEHMVFKGTQNYNAQEIAEVIENVGGNINAYTSRELTSFHVHLLKEDINLALEVVGDLVQSSTMPEEELEKERHVVLQEIGMCHDTPDDYIFDNYYETAYPDQALGAPILGTQEIISSMQRSTLVDHVRRFYTPGRCVISAAGCVDHEAFCEEVEKKFNSLYPDIRQGKIVAVYEGGEHRLEKDLEQTHIMLGFKGLDRFDENYYAAQALSTLLGGGISSRLFQEIREKRGLCYSIFSFHSSYQDSGQFAVYAGTGPKDAQELIPVLCDQLLSVRDEVTEDELARAKAQMRSGLLMARESLMNRADQQAKFLLHREEVLDIEDILQKIDSVSLQSLLSVAQSIFSGKPTLTGLGPLSHLESYDQVSQRLAA